MVTQPRVDQSRSFDPRKLAGVSLFTGAGIGDLGLRASGIDVLATCELEHDRGALTSLNFPKAMHFQGDIAHVASKLIDYVSDSIQEREDDLFLISCTAPCQGMSKSGQGTLLRNIRAGKRPTLDPRNRLILPALEVIRKLRPVWAVFE